MEALKEGFDSVFPSSHLGDLFSAHELEQLFCGNITAQWDTKVSMSLCACLAFLCPMKILE